MLFAAFPTANDDAIQAMEIDLQKYEKNKSQGINSNKFNEMESNEIKTEQVVLDDESGKREMELLRQELLDVPKRKRLRFASADDYFYNSNVGQFPPHYEKGDSVFDATTQTEIDLSGRKTDLRLEYHYGQQWNIFFSEKDYFEIEQRLRYRRKYFKKITHYIQSRVMFHSEKVVRTIDYDNRRNRWDSFQQSSLNYNFTRKMSLNLDGNLTNHRFRQEIYDDESNWQMTTTPTLFWNVTPKSRLSAAYSLAATRIRSKTGDNNLHTAKLEYFAQFTRKSSVNLNITYGHQNRKALDSPAYNSLTPNISYIFQFSPKTQFAFQLLRTMQWTNLRLFPTDPADPTEQKTHLSTDSFTISINNLLSRKIISNISFNFTHLRSKIYDNLDGDKDSAIRQFTFPVTWSFTYLITRWMRLNLSYTFNFRTGDEKADNFRSHLWKAATSFVF